MDLPDFGKRKSKTLWEFFFLKHSNQYDRIVKENRNKRLKVKHKHTIFVQKLKIKNTFQDAPRTVLNFVLGKKKLKQF